MKPCYSFPLISFSLDVILVLFCTANNLCHVPYSHVFRPLHTEKKKYINCVLYVHGNYVFFSSNLCNFFSACACSVMCFILPNSHNSVFAWIRHFELSLDLKIIWIEDRGVHKTSGLANGVYHYQPYKLGMHLNITHCNVLAACLWHFIDERETVSE